MAGYFILVLLFLALFCLSLYFGISEWLRPRDSAPVFVDVHYVRSENYFGVSFRAKMQEWLRVARPVSDPAAVGSQATILEKPNGERILIPADGDFREAGEHDQLIYSEQDLHVPKRSVFNREVYSRGNLESDEGVQLQAAAADGGMVLGFDNEVFRWVDARRKVLLRRGTAVHSRVSSMEAIELEPEVSVQSLYAPLISTAGFDTRSESARDAREKAGAPAATTDPPPFFHGLACSRLSEETWLVRADLELPDGARLDSNLVVQGALRSGSGCSFFGSLKASRVELGPDNRVSTHVVSASTLEVGRGTSIGESAIAEKDIWLHSGVRVGTAGRQAVVSAGQDVIMEADVAVYGKVAAGRAVVTR